MIRKRRAGGGGARKGAAKRARKTAATGRGKRRTLRALVLRARDLMSHDPVTVKGDMSIADLCDLLQEKNINGVPVVDNEGYLVGVVAQEDIIYGAMGHLDRNGEANGAPGRGTVRRRDRRVMAMLRERHLAEVQPASRVPHDKPFWSDDMREPDQMQTPVSAVMTSPAIAADEETPILEICKIMWNLQIHRIPILKKGKVTGLVSSMDLCRAILTGRIKA